MMLLIEKVKDVADRSGQSVGVAEDWRLNMKTTWCWKASNDLYMCYPDDVDDALSLSPVIVVVDVVVEYPSR